MVRLLLEKHGVAQSDVTFLEVPFPRMLSVLEGGDVDAVAAIEPFVTFGRKMPGNAVLSYNDLEIQPVTEISTYVVQERWLARHPRLARDFRQALNRAAAYANANPSEVRELLTRYTRLESGQVADIELPLFTSALSAARLEEMAQRVRRMGWVERMPPTAEMIAVF